MKVCKNCGTQNFDINSTCKNCGAELLNIPYCEKQALSQSATAGRKSGCSVAAKVFMVISLVSYAIAFVFALILWLIALFATQDSPSITPEIEIAVLTTFIYMLFFLVFLIVVSCMTAKYFKNINKGKEIGMAFKICTLLFVNMIAGILMLCDDGKKESLPQPESVKMESDCVMALKQYKELLDNGIIIQEEFEEKKKQILGL